MFMAPTKPLVGQQIEACFKVMGIPQSDTVEMTGEVGQKERVAAWKEKVKFSLDLTFLLQVTFAESLLPHPASVEQ